MSAESQIGVTGLAVMGANLARNIARHGVPIAVHNRTTAKTQRVHRRVRRRGRRSRGTRVARGVRRRARAPAPDHRHGQGRRRRSTRVIDELAPLLDDGRHRHRRRQLALRRHPPPHAGLRASAACASSAPASPAARRARCSARASCPAASARPTARSRRSSPTIAAQVDGTPCCTYVGPDGAGHYVKMVHNGIEYADMQLIAEAYDLLRHGAGLEVAGDRRDLRRVEPRRPRVVPDRDHRARCWPRRTRRRAARWST